jgi:hypothetical protein
MYRNADLRLPCARCGVEQPMARMTLAPAGGHWCWPCQLAAQIAEHRPAPRPPSVRRQIAIALAVGVGAVLVVLVVLTGVAWLFAMRHVC